MSVLQRQYITNYLLSLFPLANARRSRRERASPRRGESHVICDIVLKIRYPRCKLPPVCLSVSVEIFLIDSPFIVYPYFHVRIFTSSMRSLPIIVK